MNFLLTGVVRPSRICHVFSGVHGLQSYCQRFWGEAFFWTCPSLSKHVCKLLHVEKLSFMNIVQTVLNPLYEAHFFIFTTIRHQCIMRLALSWRWIASQCRCRSRRAFMLSGYYVFITFISCKLCRRTELESVCLSLRVFVSLSSVRLSVC